MNGDDLVACCSAVSVDLYGVTSHEMKGCFVWLEDFLHHRGDLVLLDVAAAKRGYDHSLWREAVGQRGEVLVVRRLRESYEQIGDLGSIHQPAKLLGLCLH